jgi:hypothetical protein
MRRVCAGAILAGLICALAGCAGPSPRWTADTVPVVTAHAETYRVRSAPCPAIDPAIHAEASRLTPIRNLQDADALTAALMGSEAAKNASLARLARSYENCRRRGGN